VQTELTKTYCIYQAQTRLLELGVEVAESRSWNKAEIQEKINLGIKLRMWLKALQYSDYLEKSVIDRLVYTLADLCDANAIPYAPVITTVEPPSILVGIQGNQGDQGEQGDEGGGVPFSYEDIQIDTVVDSFPITTSRGVEYSINIFGDDGMRTMKLVGGWSADGTDYGDDGGDGTDDIYGDTSPVTMSIVVVGSLAQLFAQVTSGTWTINGTRKYIPNNGNGIVNPTTLTNGKVWIGNASNSPTAVTVSGDFTISNTGVGALSFGVIVNTDINDSAAIAVSKLAALTTSKAVVTDSSGFLTTSATTATQIGYLSNVTSDVQAQLDSKLSSATGAISTVVSSNLTANRAVISNSLGKIAVSNVTDTELGVLSGITATTTELNYTDGVTSNIQTQLNGKQATITGAASTVVSSNLTASRIVVSDGSGKIASGTIDPSTIVTVPSGSPQLLTKVIEIGDWNMDTNSSTFFPHASLFDYTKVRTINVIIRNDANSVFIPLDSPITPSAVGYFSINGTNIALFRATGGQFDNSAYSSTSYNRGWVTVTYTT
jgi:hypothetical protein